jgi:vancomycin permeability regulator SanA
MSGFDKQPESYEILRIREIEAETKAINDQKISKSKPLLLPRLLMKKISRHKSDGATASKRTES